MWWGDVGSKGSRIDSLPCDFTLSHLLCAKSLQSCPTLHDAMGNAMTGGKGLIWELRDQGSVTNYFALQGNTFLKAML